MPASVLSGAYLVNDPQRVAELAEYCRRSARRFVAIDGFAGVGKTTLGETLAGELGAQLISLDEFLPDDPESMLVTSYVDRLDRQRIVDAISEASTAVIEGTLLRDVLQGIVRRADMTALYLARCSRPGNEGLIWHDAFRISDGDESLRDSDGTVRDPDWFTVSETEYHRRTLSHEDADAVAIRIE